MLRLDHIVIPIWDVEKSIAFYRDFLGLKLVDAHDGGDWGGFPWLMLLFALPDKREIVLVHFAGAKRPPRDKLPKDGRHIAMAETGADKHDTVIIGDTTFDIEMGKAAGTKAIGVTWGHHDPHELLAAGADLLVDTYADLPLAIEKVLES